MGHTFVPQGFSLFLSLIKKDYNGFIKPSTAYCVQIPDIHLATQHGDIFGEEANLQSGWKA